MYAGYTKNRIVTATIFLQHLSVAIWYLLSRLPLDLQIATMVMGVHLTPVQVWDVNMFVHQVAAIVCQSKAHWLLWYHHGMWEFYPHKTAPIAGLTVAVLEDQPDA